VADGGYEIIGAFQDLDHSKVPYTERELEEARDTCLEWKVAFLDAAASHQYLAFLESPSEEPKWQRRHLHRFFWGLRATYPDSNLSGRFIVGNHGRS
jgi:hypothetical protein